MEEIISLGLMIVEHYIQQGIDEYNETKDFDAFQVCLTASFSQQKFEVLKIACEELTESRKDYHIIMGFIEELNKLCLDYVEALKEEREE